MYSDEIAPSELQRIMTCIKERKNFALTGGAGSGKTYTLVETISRTLTDYPHARVACITYTRAGTKEIEERVTHPRLDVSTIHQFLWGTIKNFQTELCAAIVELSLTETNRSFRIDGSQIPSDYFINQQLSIQYKDYLKIKLGIISHDEVLLLANQMFKSYPKLCDIFKDKYQFVFIDEYQDTESSVIEIFLGHLQQSTKEAVYGFFGDSMQSIFDRGIGSLHEFIVSVPPNLIEIQKTQNRRNPLNIITLANKLRTDTLTQVPSADPSAPNMDENGQVKMGRASFYYSDSATIETIRSRVGWDFSDSSQTKELNLTHNLIAEKAGFPELMKIYDKDQVLAYRGRVRDYIKSTSPPLDFSGDTFGEGLVKLKAGKTSAELRRINPTEGMQIFIDENPDLFVAACAFPFNEFIKLYVDKDQLLDDKPGVDSGGGSRDPLVAHLFRLESNIHYYRSDDIPEFLRRTDYRIQVGSDKEQLKIKIDELTNSTHLTIGEVIDMASLHGICEIDDRLQSFMVESKYLYDRIRPVAYGEFQALYKYLNGYTSFTTLHKTKGREYSKVLVILDNGRWNSYNFENLFLSSGTASVLARTQKIFYVSCTRAMDELAVFYRSPSRDVVEKAKQWFGDMNVIDIDSIATVAP